jgi:predicted metal-dependent phosphoesterase TrpH
VAPATGNAPTFDLQSHSTHSDGTLHPAEVVRAAAEAGVELLALTDHDTVSGLDEALAAAEDSPLQLVPAAELSTLYGNYEDFHVCAYAIDHTAPALLAALEDFRADRDDRAHAMAGRLGELGFAIDDELLDERRRSGHPIGRPHIAAAVLADVNNDTRLANEGIDDIGGLIERYLVPGTPGYVPRSRPTVPQAIELIHDAGGVAVWAHPFWDVDAVDEVRRTLEDFADAGLDGVEAFYPSHTEAQVSALAQAADALDLLLTGSSDFHGPEHRLFNRFRAFELYGVAPRLGPMSY